MANNSQLINTELIELNIVFYFYDFVVPGLNIGKFKPIDDTKLKYV